MATRTGRQLAIGFGAESNWGTAVSRTVWHRGVSCTLQRRQSKVRLPRLVASSGSANRAKHYIEREDVTGDIVLEVPFEGFGLILKYILGGTPGTTGPSGGLYTHTYTLATTLPAGLTIEVVRGIDFEAGTSESEVFEGCLITKAVFRVAAGGVMLVTLSIIGETASSRSSAGSPSYSSNDLPLIHHQGGQLTWNSVARYMKSFELTIDNKLARRDLIGSTLTKRPVKADFTDIRLALAFEWEAETYYAGMHADTEADATVTFSGAGSRTWGLTFHNAYVDQCDSPVSGPGVIDESVVLVAQTDGTDEGVSLVIVNTQSSAVAA